MARETKKAPARKAGEPTKATRKTAGPKTVGANAATRSAPAKAVKAPARKTATKSASKAPSKEAAKKAPAKAAAKKTPAKAAAKKSTAPAKSKPAKAPAKKGSAAPARAKPAKKAAPRNAAVRTGTATAAPPLPPTPEGAEDWTTEELVELRAELETALAELRGEYARAIADLDDLQQRAADGAGDDQADAGTKTFEREQEMSIAHNKLDVLTQTERAVERIDAGTYGRCESCGNPIAKARLQAFPSATLCVSCKQREERR